MAEIITTIDLRGNSTKLIKVTDNIDYDTLGWDIDDVVCVLTIAGPLGAFYDNDNFEDPDIIPAQSREQIKIITIPLDPETNYTNPLKGTYTVKLIAKNLATNDTHEVLKVYSYSFDQPVINAQISVGPYTGKLRSEDITDYGDNVYSLAREHRIKYPVQLNPPIDDIVSTEAIVEVTPIYTNKWTIIISSEVEYREPDDLIILWDGSKTFYQYVYGACIYSMKDALNSLMDLYSKGLVSQIGNQEILQKRLVIVNIAWHLLNQAYMKGDEEECDRLCAVIENELELAGIIYESANGSVQVSPCPPWEGGGTPATYEFENGLVETAGYVRLGGSLNTDTNVSLLSFLLSFSAASSGLSAALSIKYDTGVQINTGSSSTQGKIQVMNNEVKLEYKDLSNSNNDRVYKIGSNGLVENSDYSGSYTARSLISKSYFDANNNWGSQVVVTDGTLIGNGTTGSPLSVANPFPGFSTLEHDYGYTEPTHSFAEITDKPTTLAGYGITDAVKNFLQLEDTPSSYSGAANKLLRVNGTETGIEFITSSGYVPDTGGTFTGQVTISTNNDYPFILKQIGTGGQVGVPEGGINLIGFKDGDGDLTAEIGTDVSGNIRLKTYVSNAYVFVDNNLHVSGDIVLTGLVDGVDISIWKSEYDGKSVNWDTAYSWGNHAGLYQPIDDDLTAIASLGFTQTAFLKKIGVNTWTLDTNVYATEDYVNNAVVTDHGELSGLGDDDHTQYALADGSRGIYRIPYGTKSSSNDAGTEGDMSRDDDYFYVCTQTGGAGYAIWKKVPLMQT